MKKLISLILCLALMLSVMTAGFAEEYTMETDADEPSAELEAHEAASDKGEMPADTEQDGEKLTRVRFVCFPEELTLKLCMLSEGDEHEIKAEDGGFMLPAGEYKYEASCEGCYSLTEQYFTLDGTDTEREIEVTLEPVILKTEITRARAAFLALNDNVRYSDRYKESVYYERLQEYELTGDQMTDITRIALTQVGYHEGDSSYDYDGMNTDGGNNYTEYGRWFGLNDAWCAMFISWCAAAAGIDSSVMTRSSMANPVDFHCPYYRYTDVTPQVGDLAFFENNSSPNSGEYGFNDHVGLIYAVDEEYVYTVEGNASDRVVMARYNLSNGQQPYNPRSYIYWLGRPNYGFGTITVAPGAPAKLKAEYLTADTAQISWANTRGADSYRVQRYDSENEKWLDDADYSEGVSYISKGLKNDSDWGYRVCAVNANGSSDWTYLYYTKPCSGHESDKGTVMTAPGCETDGVTNYRCLHCGALMKTEINGPVGHRWDSGTVTKKPTLIAAGEILYTCTACSEQRIEILPKTEEKNSVVFSVSDVNAKAGGSFKAEVTLDANTALTGFAFTVRYNSKLLELTSIKGGEQLGGSWSIDGSTAVWKGTKAFSGNGAAATLYFRLKDSGFAGYGSISLSCSADSVTTVNGESANVHIFSGTLGVSELLMGDADGNGTVNLKDAVLLLKYATGEKVTVDSKCVDMNGDGQINLKDAVLLLRYVTGEKII